MILTLVWLLGFLACVGIIEVYIRRSQLVDEDRIATLRPVALFYGSYLTLILASWYKPVFGEVGYVWLLRARFTLALVATLLVNTLMVYLVASNIFGSNKPVQENVMDAVTICGLMSFIVAPVNAYYFGSSRQRRG